QQDHAAVDHQEQTAATVTKGVGLIAGAVILVLLLVLCGRWLF
ncbi:MAG: translation initiation factor 2, partial [Dactylosporangium sp.]|nr:translation initiation factor 2 [Dactylosporangium sp.]